MYASLYSLSCKGNLLASVKEDEKPQHTPRRSLKPSTSGLRRPGRSGRSGAVREDRAGPHPPHSDAAIQVLLGLETALALALGLSLTARVPCTTKCRKLVCLVALKDAHREAGGECHLFILPTFCTVFIIDVRGPELGPCVLYSKSRWSHRSAKDIDLACNVVAKTA